MSQQPERPGSRLEGPTPTSAGNKIVELDPDRFDHAEDIPKPTEKLEEVGLDHEQLADLCDQLSEIGADGQSALLEIERRHMADNPDHIMRFTVKELTSIVVSLAIAHTVNTYNMNRDANDPIHEFGFLIARQEDAPMDGTHGLEEFPGMGPFSNPNEDVDPFKVIRGSQQLAFLDDDGEPIQPKDRDQVDLPGE